MPFPEEVLSVRVEAYIDETWTDITDWVYKESIEISRGSADESSYSQPTSTSFLLNNRDGRFSPRNPNSPYFGMIGRNTPLRVSVDEGDPYLSLPGAGKAGTDGFTTPADFDIRVDAQLTNWSTPNTETVELAACYDSGTTSGWIFRAVGGYLNIGYGDGATFRSATLLQRFVTPPHGRMTVRVASDPAAEVFRFYQGDSVDGPWTFLGEEPYPSGAAPAGATSTLGAGSTFINYSPPAGRYFRVQVRDGSNGPSLADIDFTQQVPGDTAFADPEGNDWYTTAGAEVSRRYTRFNGEVVAWPSRWTTGGFDAWVTMSAESAARRYNQNSSPLRSVMAQTIPLRPTLIAYWPMEDPDGVTTLSALSPNTRNMSFYGDLSPGTHAGPPGSDDLPTLNEGAFWRGEATTSLYPVGMTGWQVQLLLNPNQLDTGLRTVFRIQTSGFVQEWRIFMSQTTMEVRGYTVGPDGELAETYVQNSGTWEFGSAEMSLAEAVNHWQKWEFSCQNTGSFDINWRLTGVLVEEGAGDTIDFTIPGRAGFPYGVQGTLNGLSADLNGLSVGHVAIYHGTGLSIFDRADVGYLGETPIQRLERLTEERSESLVAYGTRDGWAMGEQRPDRFLDLMREAAITDRGIFGDHRESAAFWFVGREALYSQTPVLVLDYEADGHVHAPLDPTDDDLYLRNRVTAEQERGGSAVVERADGPLSVQPVPAGVGPYESTVTVNTRDAFMLRDIAAWEVHLGTWDEERYPTVLLRLQAAPELIRQALMIDQGAVIMIRNARRPDSREWIPPGDILLMVRGYREVLNQFQWEIELQCVPARPYSVPVLTGSRTDPSSQAHDHVDTDGSELIAAVDEDDVILPVHVYAGPTWTDRAVDYPFELTVDGEQVRATAPGGVINDNAFFDETVTGWSGTNAAITRSQEWVHPEPSAVASALVTPSGGGVAVLVSDLQAAGTVKPGGKYVISGWVYSPTGWASGVAPVVAWYTDGGSSLGAAGGSAVPVPADTWTWVEATLTAPATAGRYQVGLQQAGSPTASDLWYAWGVRLTRATADWANDTFTRTVASGWGEMDSGDDWLNEGGTAANYAVNGSVGQHTMTAAASSRRSSIGIPGEDFDLYVDLAVSATATGDAILGGLMGRYTDIDNLYTARVEFRTDGTLDASITKRVGGTETSLGYLNREVPYSAGTYFTCRFQGAGSLLRMKIYPAGTPEIPAWHLTATDTSLTTGNVGVRSIRGTSNTNTNPVMSYDNFRVANPQVLAVERSRNGVEKAHTEHSDVRLTYPAITSL